MPPARKVSAGLATVVALAIASGARAQDCNANGIPDAGEVESGLSPDCNGNRVPDDCDIEPTIAFGPGARVEIGTRVTPPAIDDLDGDGDVDIVLVRRARNQGSHSPESAQLVMMRNSGDGSFTVVTAELLDDPELVIAGDFDGDRDVDLAALMSGGLRVLHNRGDGAFVGGGLQDWQGPTLDGAPLDADRDGDLDLAILSAPAVTVLFNSGHGTFPYRSPYAVGQSRFMSVVDEGHDQLPDLFVNGNTRELLQNLGDGTFQHVFLSISPASPSQMTELAQLDGRHGLDAMTALQDAVRVQLRAENGAFPFSADFPFPGDRFPAHSTTVIAFSADRDADLDLAATLAGDLALAGMTTVFANDGDGNLRLAGTLPVEGTGFTTTDAADLDGDRDAEIVIVNLEAGIVATWRNDSFGAASADRNRDGVPDECIDVFFRRGDADSSNALDLTDAQFLLDHLYRGGMVPTCLEAADANDDGVLDLGDPIHILNHLFLGGPPPPAPGPPPLPCGPDPEGSRKLGCLGYKFC